MQKSSKFNQIHLDIYLRFFHFQVIIFQTKFEVFGHLNTQMATQVRVTFNVKLRILKP